MKKILYTLLLAQATFIMGAYGQTEPAKTNDTATVKTTVAPTETKKKWFETLTLRGYAQIRYNRLLETNKDLKCDQCDKSIGDKGGIVFRRARITLSGNVHERLFIYIQTDVATNASMNSSGTTGLNYLQLRDFYGDIFLTKSKSFRLRLGLSKVPFGFDVLQSSSNRAAFDRSDALNSAAINERDMGAFLYFTPVKTQELYKKLQNSKLKGSGDYGVFGIGVYNGQTANRLETNNDMHSVARINYPFEIKSQVLEIGGFAYSGYYNVKEIISSGVTTPRSNKDVVDQRIGASIVLYPKPIGFQAEYNWGEGPTFTEATPGVFTIERKHLEGGYAQLSGAFTIRKNFFTPYVRYQYYNGGKKNETDARYHLVKETEIGMEWHPANFMELTAAYMISDRVFEDSTAPSNHQYGNLLRLQLQLNY